QMHRQPGLPAARHRDHPARARTEGELSARCRNNKTRSKTQEADVAGGSGAAAMAEKRLGRGLAALIGDVGEESAPVEQGRKPRRAPIESLKPNPRNPRKAFTEAELAELAASIKERGVIQPI